MSHIIVSPGGRCQAVTWKKKNVCVNVNGCAGFISFIFHGPFFRSARRMKTRKGKLEKGDSVWRVLFTL